MFAAGWLATVRRQRRAAKHKRLLEGKEESISKMKRLQRQRDKLHALQTQHLPTWHFKFSKTLIKVECSSWFQLAVIVVIILAGVSAGVSTYESQKGKLNVLDNFILGAFILEAVIKIFANGRRPWVYFRDGWNVFDFSIIVLSFIPLSFDFTTLRLLRVLKLLNAIAPLQILVVSLLKSTKAIGYVIMLLGLVFYLYAVMACFLFKQNDPFHFRDLQLAFLSLYRVSTFEDWTDIMYINMYGCDKYGYSLDPNRTKLYSTERLPEFMFCTKPHAYPVVSSLFFCSFTLVSAMVLFKLFIGVILTNIAKAEEDYKSTILKDLDTVRIARRVAHALKHTGAAKREFASMSDAQSRWHKLQVVVISGHWRALFSKEIAATRRRASFSVSEESLVATEAMQSTVDRLVDHLHEKLEVLEGHFEELKRLNREWDTFVGRRPDSKVQ